MCVDDEWETEHADRNYVIIKELYDIQKTDFVCKISLPVAEQIFAVEFKILWGRDHVEVEVCISTNLSLLSLHCN